jgi:tRNA-specific 2-thiouridylase
VLNLESAFGHDVVQDFVDEYARGRTPIPCVRCNTFTKFRDLVRKADVMDAQWIATGHYARVIDGALHRGLDPAKDQSYFLWGIDRRVLSRLLLPVGAQTKVETRAIAHDLGLELIAEKRESQDICFVPDGDHTRVIARVLGPDSPALARGPLTLRDGTVVGEHTGYARFTVGQRRGLPGGFGEPMFVIAIEPATRSVVIGRRDELVGHGVVAREVNWLGTAPAVGAEVAVQIRHRARAVSGVVVRHTDDEVEVALEEPASAISPGQSCVFYAGDRVLGGGVIERGRRELPVRAA